MFAKLNYLWDMKVTSALHAGVSAAEVGWGDSGPEALPPLVCSEQVESKCQELVPALHQAGCVHHHEPCATPPHPQGG